LARINAEIQEKQSDLDDTRFQHSIDMQSEGYDRLSKDSQKALEDTIKAIEGSAIEQEKIVSLMLNRLE